jgi:S1-C subfamily serine protease
VSEYVNADIKVTWIHNDPILANFDHDYCQKLYLPFDKIICVSDAVREKFNQFLPEYQDKTMTFHNVFDEEKINALAKDYIPFEKSTFDIVTVAREDNNQKRIDGIIHICKRLKEEGISGFKWRVVGDGPSLESNKVLAETLGVDDIISLEGEKINPYPYIYKSDLFALYSAYEGFPMVVGEAQALGTYILTTNYAAAKEQILPEQGCIAEDDEDFYLKFNDGFMSIYENTSNVTAEFLKLFPAVDENDEAGPYVPSTGGSSSINTSSSPSATGSGIFVSEKVVVTNHHVISGAKKIEVIIKDGNKVSTYTAKMLSTDKTNDLALISIEDEKFTGIGTLPFAISTRTRDVGTSIFTMGYPMATYMGEEVKITDGIINSKTGYDGDIVTYQISAPIQPGSSGGPLFDKAGYLIGITNAGIREAQNVGYAIKGSYLCNLIESAPVTIAIPETNTIENLELTEQVKQLSKYVVFIKVY